MNVDGGGGSRLKGPAGQPGQLNGMPSKKSQSTSKLSGKGEQGNYQTEREHLALLAAGPGETVGDVIIPLLLTDGEGEDCDWVAPHQNTVSHVDPHAPLAGLPPGEGNAPLPPSFLSDRTSHLAPGEWRHLCKWEQLVRSKTDHRNPKRNQPKPKSFFVEQSRPTGGKLAETE